MCIVCAQENKCDLLKKKKKRIIFSLEFFESMDVHAF